MSRFACGIAEDAPAWHGALSIEALSDGMPSAAKSHWFARCDWSVFDDWMEGGPHPEEGLPYANLLIEAAGLRSAHRPYGRREWARSMRTQAELGEAVGFLFFSDVEASAQRYGTAHGLDLRSPSILDVIEDPHVRTHHGWIAIIAAGEPVPFVATHLPRP